MLDVLNDVGFSFTVHACVLVCWEVIKLGDVGESSQHTITQYAVVSIRFFVVDSQSEQHVPVSFEVTAPFEPSSDRVLLREWLRTSDLSVLFLGGGSGNGVLSNALHCDYILEVCHGSLARHSGELSDGINERSIADIVGHLGDESVESRVVELLTTERESKISDLRVNHIELYALRVLWIILDEGNCTLCLNTVRKVEVGPDTLNIGRVVDVLVEVGILVSFVEGCEVVVTLPLPRCQQPVTVFHIIIGLVYG